MHDTTTSSHVKQDLSHDSVSKSNIIENATGPFNPVKGEMALWTAVITQALMDAGSGSRKPEAQHEKAKAIRWLLGNSEDFVAVCQNAGLDPQYVREKARKAIERGCIWRRATNDTPHKQAAPLVSDAPPIALERKYYIPTRPANQPLPPRQRRHFLPRPAALHYNDPSLHAPSPAYGNC